MAIVEDITEHDVDDEGYTSEKVLNAVKALVNGLNLSNPAQSSGRDIDSERTINAIYKLSDLLVLPSWLEISASDQVAALRNVLALYDPGSDVQKIIDQQITPHLSPSIPVEILLSLRQSFTSHPSLSSSTSRALSRPIGGQNASIDMQDHQPFKIPLPSGGSISNLLYYAITLLSSEQVEKHIGLILPPTLVMMDDYEPIYREKGVWVLDGWMGKLQPVIMRRMGIDKLLLKSLIHTLSLHPNPPLNNVLEITLRFIEQSIKEGGGKERAEVYAEIMDKAIVQGWIYSPSGIEGRVVLIDIARKVEIMCGVLRLGIVRWLKSIIPSLIGPLQYPPTPLVLPHYIANLSALLCVLRTIRSSGRITRWRGQILNVLCRLVVQLHDRGVEVVDGDNDRNTHSLKRLLKDVFAELADQVPSVKNEEYQRLIDLSPHIFEEFVRT